MLQLLTGFVSIQQFMFVSGVASLRSCYTSASTTLSVLLTMTEWKVVAWSSVSNTPTEWDVESSSFVNAKGLPKETCHYYIYSLTDDEWYPNVQDSRSKNVMYFVCYCNWPSNVGNTNVCHNQTVGLCTRHLSHFITEKWRLEFCLSRALKYSQIEWLVIAHVSMYVCINRQTPETAVCLYTHK